MRFVQCQITIGGSATEAGIVRQAAAVRLYVASLKELERCAERRWKFSLALLPFLQEQLLYLRQILCSLSLHPPPGHILLIRQT